MALTKRNTIVRFQCPTCGWSTSDERYEGHANEAFMRCEGVPTRRVFVATDTLTSDDLYYDLDLSPGQLDLLERVQAHLEGQA